MSMMHVQLYDALINAGASEEHARAAAASIVGPDQVATKADLTELRSDLSSAMHRMEIRLIGWVLSAVVLATAILIAVLG